MATVQVILNGMPGGTMHDTETYPVVLQFDDKKAYAEAVWIIPSYPGHIPADMLSEIRVSGGPLTVFVEGPEGFHSGPHETDWVRSDYPRGKLCSFLQMDAESHKMGGVTVQVVEGSLVIDPLSLGGPAKTEPSQKTEQEQKTGETEQSGSG